MSEANTELLFNYTLSQADSVLVLGQRMLEWTGKGPILEEDIALSNLGLDLIGQARALYTYAGHVEGKGRDEDKLAYFRDAPEFRNLLLVEQPNGDFAMTMMRHYLYSSFAYLYWEALKSSNDATLAAIAAKAVKELAYHRRHSAEWVLRLGDGTEESHQRSQHALDTLWPYSGEMFVLLPEDQSLVEQGIAVDVSALRQPWQQQLDSLMQKATLQVPDSNFMHQGGRKGLHTEQLGYILAELQHLQRSAPGLNW